VKQLILCKKLMRDKIQKKMLEVRFLQQWSWRALSTGMWYRVVQYKFTDVSEASTTSIRVSHARKQQDISGKQSSLKWCVMQSTKTLQFTFHTHTKQQLNHKTKTKIGLPFFAMFECLIEDLYGYFRKTGY
jgi:hypothetical protein